MEFCHFCLNDISHALQTGIYTVRDTVKDTYRYGVNLVQEAGQAVRETVEKPAGATLLGIATGAILGPAAVPAVVG